MKTLLKLTSFMALAFTITACQKDNHSTAVETPKEKISLEQLWERMQLPSDASGDAATLAIYASLDAKELADFQTLRLQKDSLQLAKKIADANNGRVSAAQEVNIGLQLKKTKATLATLQQEALTKFNKQINQLSQTEISELLTFHQQAKAGDVSVMACPLVSFSGTASVKSANGVRAYDYYSIGNLPGPDCDWEFRFDGYYWYVYGQNIFTRQLLNYYGGVISRRIICYSDGCDTAVLLGYNATAYYCLGPWGVSIDALN
jgi:hypothetical protein